MSRTLVVTFAVTSLCACGGCSQSHANDARDAGEIGLFADGGIDATPVGPLECAPPTVPPSPWDCAVVPVEDGGWATLSCFPQGCEQRIGLNPATQAPPVVWQPCTDGRLGCQELVDNWVSPASTTHRVLAQGIWREDGPWMWLSRWEIAPEGEVLQSLESPAGAANAVFRGHRANFPVCSVGNYGEFSQAMAGTSTVTLAGASWLQYFFVGIPSDPTAFQIAFVTFDSTSCGGQIVDQVSLGDGGFSAETSPGRTLWRVNGRGQRARRLADITVAGSWPEHPTHLDNGTLFVSDTGGSQPAAVWYVPNGDVPRPVIQSPTDDVFTYAVDGTSIVWFQGQNPAFGGHPDGGYYTSTSMWTGTLNPDGTVTGAQLLSNLPDRSPIPYSPGYAYGFLFLPSEVFSGAPCRLVHVTDGTYWPINPDPGTQFMQLAAPVWIGPDEIALQVQSVDEQSTGLARTIYRISYDSLGARVPLPR